MGREIKRVAAGFDWPLSKVWKGFIDNPHHPRKCEPCDGSGSSPAARFFHNQWYGQVPFDPASTGSKPHGEKHPIMIARARRNVLVDFNTGKERPEKSADADIIAREARRLANDCFDSHWSSHLSPADVKALIKDDRLTDLTSDWTPEKKWVKHGRIPTAAQVNEWSLQGMAHDSINCWVCVSARCKREGIESKCPECGGSGINPADKEIEKAQEKWKSTSPPKGDWWQVWETVSEGSPVTPAFATAEELVDYLVANGDAWDQKRGDGGWTRENAQGFVGVGYAPSAMMVNGAPYSPRDGMPKTD